MENMYIYEQVRQVPEEAKKTIRGGRLSGMTDINPMWRIKKLTELFGPAGRGWWTENVKTRTEEGPNGERAVCVELDLVYIVDAENKLTSGPIHGVGGSMLIASETKGLRLDDEAWKKAYTDALSVACKALGIGADVYWSADSTKYTTGKRGDEPAYTCERCKGKITATTSKDGQTIPPAQLVQISRVRWNGGTFCAECQKALEKARKERESSGLSTP